jgi:peptidoglycan/LPS O-acetylase OafA/YrhL
VQLCCAWPALLLTAHSRRRAVALAFGLFVTATAFDCFLWGIPALHNIVRNHLLDEFPLTWAGPFALGAALALVRRTNQWGSLRRRMKPLLAAGIAGYVLAALLGRSVLPATRPMFLLGLPSLALAGSAALALALEPSPRRRSLSRRPLAWLGRISYGAFVLQGLLLPVAGRIAQKPFPAHGAAFFLARFLVGFVLTIVAAELAYELLEIPLLRRKRDFPFLRPASQV